MYIEYKGKNIEEGRRQPMAEICFDDTNKKEVKKWKRFMKS